MKSNLICPILALGLGTVALAGEFTSPSTYTAPPSDTTSLWNWFVGGSVGYLLDSEEEYYTLHLGKKIGESGPMVHSLFLEGAYAELSGTDIVPVTLNYKLDYYLTESFSFYAGAGAGVAFIDHIDHIDLAVQAFAGLGYDLTSNFQIYTGARWIWIDDSGDDTGLELGARFKF